MDRYVRYFSEELLPPWSICHLNELLWGILKFTSNHLFWVVYSQTILHQGKLTGERKIRLMSLRPGKVSDPIMCDLTPVNLDMSLKYDALSYEWKKDKDLTNITCGSTSLSVTRNLAEALRALRHPASPKVLWADAICIYFDRYQTGYRRKLRFGPPFSKGVLFMLVKGADFEHRSRVPLQP
jgi:hypothetical protein